MISNDSWQSSGSLRLNQDIMSAKIEGNLDISNAIHIPTNNGQSSSSLGERGGDYQAAVRDNIMVQKLNSIDTSQRAKLLKSDHNTIKITKNQGELHDSKGNNKITVFATVDADNLKIEGVSPSLTRGTSPKRKSVLSRNSKASPKVIKSTTRGHKRELEKSQIHTL